ncbi:MAG: biopolymer transporter ExbD [Bacteroidales bacterium]|nr:biopolymer transporter ExbD [Bacteroidales bacterium]
MGEIIQEEKSKKGGKRRAKKHSPHLDMTPMVDLMCLLITFFMLTTAFSKPKVMEITMPKKDTLQKPESQIKVPKDRTYNIILTQNDKVVYLYQGSIDKDTPNPPVIKTDLSKDGLRKFLLEKNKTAFKQIAELKEKVLKGQLKMADSTLNRKIKEIKKNDKKGPIILIKAADDKVKYRSIVDVIDEMAICDIGSYAVVDISKEEKKLLESAPK